jgi:hypothetical protein
MLTMLDKKPAEVTGKVKPNSLKDEIEDGRALEAEYSNATTKPSITVRVRIAIIMYRQYVSTSTVFPYW